MKAHTPLLFFMLQRKGAAPAWLFDEEGNWPIPEDLPQTQAARTEHEEETARESAQFNAQEFISAEQRAAKLLALKGQRYDERKAELQAA
jgi:hypothetical protein